MRNNIKYPTWGALSTFDHDIDRAIVDRTRVPIRRKEQSGILALRLRILVCYHILPLCPSENVILFLREQLQYP